MINTDLLTFQITFKNSSSKIIFNVSNNSINDLIDFLNNTSYKLDKVKQYDRAKDKFLCIPKQKLFTIIDHKTELLILLQK